MEIEASKKEVLDMEVQKDLGQSFDDDVSLSRRRL